MADLSVLIPARNEEWLAHTIRDVLEHTKADTEVIVVLDGAWPEPGLEKHPRVQVIHHAEPIGQRAATNLAARVSNAKYICKLDAHCSVADGFDVALIEAATELGPDVTQIPAQKNLHVYDVVCDNPDCNWRQYQGVVPSACPSCKGTNLRRDVVWKPRRGVHTTSWVFDETIHFQYDRFADQRQKTDITDVMSSLGACFFMERERFWQLGGLDEGHGSWGNFGVEIACKSWLSGGRHVVNRRTWFAHFFRVGGIGFPYEIHGSDQERARQYSRSLWLSNSWPGQVRPLSWLIEKFKPVQGWHEPHGAKALASVIAAGEKFPPIAAKVQYCGALNEGPMYELTSDEIRQANGMERWPARDVIAPRSAKSTAAILYYSDGKADETILTSVRRHLRKVAGDVPIVAVTLQPTEDWGAERVVLQRERGYETMARQIYTGLRIIEADCVFFAEHDCLYPAGYFDHRPSSANVYGYAGHTWKVDADTGKALHYKMEQLSGLCADRQLLLTHYKARLERMQREGFSRRMGFEPGKPMRHGGVDDVPRETWWNEVPIVDIRHGANLTPSRWSKEEFRNQKYTEGWTESDRVPGWGVTLGRFDAFLREAVG